MPNVQMPDGRVVSFPDGTPPDTINAVLGRIHAVSPQPTPANRSAWQSPHPAITQALSGLAPGLALAGATLGTPFGPLGRAGLSALFGSAGQGISDIGNEIMGATVPGPAEAAMRLAKTGAIQGVAQGTGESAVAAATGLGRGIAGALSRRALASPQLARYLTENPNLPMDVVKQGLTVGGETGSPMAEANVAGIMNDMPPLLQAAHNEGFSATPESFRPDFEQQLLKRFNNKTLDSPAVMDALRAKFNQWVSHVGTLRSATMGSDPLNLYPGAGGATAPAPPLGAFDVQGLKQGLDRAAEKVYANQAAAERGLFPPVSQADLDNADFNKMMADIMRKRLETIGGGKTGSIGSAIKALNERAGPAMVSEGAIRAAESAGVPKSQSIRPFSLMHGLGFSAGPPFSRAALAMANPRLRAALAVASYAGGLPFAAAPPDQVQP